MAIGRGCVARIEAMPWDEAANLGVVWGSMTGPSGIEYRVRSETFWDTHAWGSDLNIHVRVYPPSGRAKRRGLKAWGVKGGETLPALPAD
jgi:hypothetical protein